MHYIVSAPKYSENSGGAIFQHLLVHTLNALGESAFVWPQPDIYPLGRRERLRRLFRPPPYRLSEELNTPVFRGRRAPADAVVVYPEVVRGNPLRAEHVVRWLLYKPGLRHPFEFGEHDMFFRVGDFTDMPELTGGAPDLFVWQRNRVYRDLDRPDRSGVCFIVRKGLEKPRLPITEAEDAIQIDGKSHAEINEIFNRCKTFVSYDEATMYSQFAAICGCDSVIVPGLFASQDEWAANHMLGRYGVAYGFENLGHAWATRHLVEGMLDAKEAESLSTVEDFIRLTKERFACNFNVPLR